MDMSTEFDPKKDLANLKKHGVSLSAGNGVLNDPVLNDPLAITIEDDSAEGEQRFITIRMNLFGSLMVVCAHTTRWRNEKYFGTQGGSQRTEKL